MKHMEFFFIYPTFLVDVDMFHKSAHHCIYQVCRVWNSKIGAKCQWRIQNLVGKNLL